MNKVERLNELVTKMNESLAGSYLNKIQCLSEYDYVFEFSRPRTENLFISLNIKNPFVRLIHKKFLFNSTSSFFQRLKSKLQNANFRKASVYNDDNILCLEFYKTSDTYDKYHYFLIFEIFKSNSNLILLEENKISEAFRFKGIDTHHPVIKNMIYEPPLRQDFSQEIKEKDVINEDFYLNNIEKMHIDNKYKDISVNLKRRLKSLKKKLENIEDDKSKALNHLKYKDYADYLLTILDEVKRGDSYFMMGDEKVDINELYSPSENLQYFYKQYKKAKLTIQSTDQYIQKTKDEIEYIETTLNNLSFYNEDDYQDLIIELENKKIIKIDSKNKRKNQPKNLKNAAKPYYFFYNSVKIGFGKNAIQNDNLTFKEAPKNSYFIHMKNVHGNHVVIFSDELSDDLLEFACELCVYLSKKNDGEVLVAASKSIKKGNQPGLVLLNNYESYTIKNLNYDFSKYLAEAKRF